MRARPQAWALASDGYFRARDDEGGGEGGGPAERRVRFVRWREAVESEELRAGVAWGRTKRPGRAIEKALRVYQQVGARGTAMQRLLPPHRRQWRAGGRGGPHLHLLE